MACMSWFFTLIKNPSHMRSWFLIPFSYHWGPDLRYWSSKFRTNACPKFRLSEIFHFKCISSTIAYSKEQDIPQVRISTASCWKLFLTWSRNLAAVFAPSRNLFFGIRSGSCKNTALWRRNTCVITSRTCWSVRAQWSTVASFFIWSAVSYSMSATGATGWLNNVVISRWYLDDKIEKTSFKSFKVPE